ETSGWPLASKRAREALESAISMVERAGVEVVSRTNHPAIADLEAVMAEALALSNEINTWEMRWPLNTYRHRDASKLSQGMLDRLAHAEAMTPEAYHAALARRTQMRTAFARLSTSCEGCVTLSAPGAAPVGLETTGNPIFAVVASLLGVPAVSLPVLTEDSL